MARPQAFNNNEVLYSAMHAYWQKGLKTSIRDLEIATGISRSSLYNSFGDKDDMFKLCMDLYVTQTIGTVISKLSHTSFKKGAFEIMVEASTNNLDGRGCLLYNCFVDFNNLSVTNKKVLQDNFSKLKNSFVYFAEKALKNGELNPEIDISALISSIMSTIAGIRAFRAVGVDSNELIQGAQYTIDGLIK